MSILFLSSMRLFGLTGLLHEAVIKVTNKIVINDKCLVFILLLFCIHFIVEACADFVDIIDAATEHISIFLPRKFEVREQAITEL